MVFAAIYARLETFLMQRAEPWIHDTGGEVSHPLVDGWAGMSEHVINTISG